MHKSTIWSHLAFWWQAVHCDSCHQTLGVIKLFQVKSSKLPEISLFVGLLVMQTLYINNVLSIFIEQYFNDTLKNDCMLLTYHARISEWIYTLYVPECQGNPYSKQARYLKFKWQQRDSNVQHFSSSTNTQPFSQTGQMIKLCCEYLCVRCIWLSVTCNIQSNAPYRQVLTTQLSHLANLAKWMIVRLRLKAF